MSSTARGADLQVALITLIPISTGISRIYGIRTKVGTSSSINGNIPCFLPSGQTNGGDPSACRFVSGDIPVLVGTLTRRLKETFLEISPLAQIHHAQAQNMKKVNRRTSPGSSSSIHYTYHHPTPHKKLYYSNLNEIPSFLQHRKLLELQISSNTQRIQSSNTVVMAALGNTGNYKYGDGNGDGKFDITDYLFAQEYYNGANILGCPTKGGIGCQTRTSLSNWQDAQLHPVSDPSASNGGRDLFYIFNTYADKLRFVVGIDFRVSIDYLYIGIKLVDRTGVVPQPGFSRVLFALRTTQPDLRFLETTWYDSTTGLLLVYGTMVSSDGWYAIRTHANEPNSTTIGMYPMSLEAYQQVRMIGSSETNVGVAFSVETSTYDGNWVSDPSRRFPFFGINYGPYAAGFDAFSPYAYINISASLDAYPFLLHILDGMTFPMFVASYSNASLAALVAKVTVIDAPYPVVNGGVNWVPPPVFYQAYTKLGVAGVNMSASANILNKTSWLSFPIAYMLGWGLKDVYVGPLQNMDVSYSAVNMSKKYNVSEWNVILRESNHVQNSSIYILGGLTGLVNSSTIAESALILEYIKYRRDYLSAASTDGLIKLAALYPDTANVRILEGVSKTVVDLAVSGYVVLKKRPVVVADEQQYQQWFSGGSSNRLDVKFLRHSLVTSMSITFVVLVVMHVYWEFFEYF